MRSDEIHPGDVIAGKYRVRAILSRSPTFVVEAFHVEFDQRVVIKLLLPGTSDDKEVDRFRREARVLAKLESEHAARILDVGTQPDGTFYLVRQHVEGEDLDAYVRRNGPRPLQEAVTLVLQAAECVAETHSHNVVLREISPQNLLLARRPGGSPLVKITDFGTAKLMRDAAAPSVQSSLTMTALFGLSPYSSPELVRKAKNVDGRADVWSLGAVLYFLLSGRPPFHGDVTQLMLAIVREEPMPITRLRADLPPQLDDLIGWSMAKDVDRRFKSIYAFAHALKPFAGPEGHLLVDRIGAIAHQQGARLAARVTPPSYDGPDLNDAVEISATSLEDEHDPYIDDDATAVLDSSGLQHLAREITDNMGNVVPGGVLGGAGRGGAGYGGALGSPPAGPMSYAPNPASLAARGISVPPPTPSIPPSPFPAHIPRPSSIAPRITSMDAGPAGLPGSRPDMVSAATLMSFGPGSRSGKAKPARDLRVVWGGLAAMAVMLPVIVLLLSRGPREPATDGPIAVGASAPAGAPPKMADPVALEAVRAPEPGAVVKLTADPAPAVPPPADPVAEPPPSDPAQPSDPPPRVAAGGPARQEPTKSDPPRRAPERTAKSEPPPKRDEPKSSKRDEPKPEATSGGGAGRLLAIASGGSCTFSVDGSAKGNGSSLSVSLSAGKHTVTCKPLSGSAKSRGVTIKPNETSMLTFKL